MTSAHRDTFLLVVLLVSSAVSLAQVKTGTPRFGTFGGGPDIINLSNLNVQVTIPVLHKPGRGLPFDFGLTYNSSIWSIPAFTGSSSWQPVVNWGWGNAGSDIGHITFSTSTLNCIVSGRVVGTKRLRNNKFSICGINIPVGIHPQNGLTRHPRMGAVEQLWLLYRNHPEISDLRNFVRYPAPEVPIGELVENKRAAIPCRLRRRVRAGARSVPRSALPDAVQR